MKETMTERKYESTEVTLADEQHDDMCNIVNATEDVSKEDLENILLRVTSMALETRLEKFG